MRAPYFQRDGIRIFHGDALEIIPELEPSSFGALITDPPYSSGGAFRGDRVRPTVEKYVHTGTLAYRPDFAGDNRDQRGFFAWCSLWLAAARAACLPSAHAAVFSDWRQLPTLTDALQAGGWTWRGVAVWSKVYGRVNSAGFSAAAEFVAWGTNGPAPEERDTYPPGVFEAHPPRDREHVAQKPEEVMRWLCSVVSKGLPILDPFMGSGTTLRAAKDMGNPAVGIDSDERYCEMAARRLAQGVLEFEDAPAS